MSTTKSTNSQEAAAAFDPNRFFGHTPEKRWYATRAAKRNAPTSRREFELDQALSNAYEQYPIEQVAEPVEIKLSEAEIQQHVAWIVGAGQALARYRFEESGERV